MTPVKHYEVRLTVDSDTIAGQLTLGEFASRATAHDAADVIASALTAHWQPCTVTFDIDEHVSCHVPATL